MNTLEDLINSKEDWYKAELMVTFLFKVKNKIEKETIAVTVKSTDNFFNTSLEDNSLPVTINKTKFYELNLDLYKEINRGVLSAKVEGIEILKYMDDDSLKQVKLEEECLSLGVLKSRANQWETAIIVYKKSNFKTDYSECERSYRVESSDKFFDTSMLGNGLFGTCIGTLDRCKLSNYNWEVDYCYITKLK